MVEPLVVVVGHKLGWHMGLPWVVPWVALLDHMVVEHMHQQQEQQGEFGLE